LEYQNKFVETAEWAQ